MYPGDPRSSVDHQPNRCFFILGTGGSPPNKDGSESLLGLFEGSNRPRSPSLDGIDGRGSLHIIRSTWTSRCMFIFAIGIHIPSQEVLGPAKPT